MQIFWLDEDIEKAVQYHCDRHVGNQVKEFAQILSTAAHERGFWKEWMYEPVPTMNPVIHEWVAESKSNIVRVVKFARHLHDEYAYRYGRTHKSYEDVVSNFALQTERDDMVSINDLRIHDEGVTDPPICMSDIWKVGDDLVESYRNFYSHGKGWSMSWTKRPVPDWYVGEVKGVGT